MKICPIFSGSDNESLIPYFSKIYDYFHESMLLYDTTNCLVIILEDEIKLGAPQGPLFFRPPKWSELLHPWGNSDHLTTIKKKGPLDFFDIRGLEPAQKYTI